MSLEHALERHWPPHRVTASCGECGKELFDSHKEKPTMRQSSYVSKLIEAFARRHRGKTGHDDLNVGIDPNPTQVREIDATITVNGE